MGLLAFLLLFSFSAWSTQIKVMGAKVLRSEIIRERIENRLKNQEINPRELDQLRFQILGLYRRIGFPEARLEFEQISPKLLVCHITEGKQILLGDISIVGNKFFSNEVLIEKIKEYVQSDPVESGWVNLDREEISSLLDPEHDARKKKFVYFENGVIPFNKSLFFKAKDTLEELYLDQGFLEVQIFGPKESDLIGKNWVNLQYRIEEGTQTRVTSIRFLGAEPSILDPAIRVGEPLNFNLVDDLGIQVKEFYSNEGYPHVEVSDQVNASEVVYQVNLGDRVRIQDIEIYGNQLTKKQVILKRLKIRKGDWYSLGKLTESRSNILQTDLFSEVNMDLDGDTLLISVKERERNTFELGVGASLVDGPRVTGIWQHRNIFGRGITLRTRAQLNYPAVFYGLPILYPTQVSEALKNQTSNYLAYRATAGFLYPKMLWVPFDLDSAVDFNAERVLQQAYVLNDVSTTFSLFSQLLPSLRLTPQIELEYANFDCSTCTNVNQNLPNVSTRFDQGIVKQATFRVLSLFDQRDNSLNPKKGYAVELNSDFGLGSADAGPVSYVKVVAGLTTYVPLVRHLTWVFNTRAGGIWNLVDDAYLPIFKRFYLGGTNSVRGFQDNQVFPVDQTSNTSVSLGGNYFIFARNEIRFPIVGDLEGGIFVDTGELMQNINNFGFQKLALGTGFGIRYNTPIGPLMFDIGIRLFDNNRISHDNFINMFGLHFSIGNAI